jgi:predicted Zn-dependent protease
MKFTADVYGSDGIYGYFFKYICDEFVNNIKEHPEIDEFIKKYNVPLLAKQCFTSDMMGQELQWHKGHLRKDDVKIALRNWRDKEQNSCLGIYTEWVYRDGKIWIGSLTLQIRSAPLCMDICKFINDLDLYKRFLSWAVKHEVGHVLDYINTRHGLSVDEYNTIIKRDKDEYDQYFEETADIRVDTLEQMIELNEKYYALTQERAANNAIGISVSELNKIEAERNEKYFSKMLTITIDQSDIRDVPKEEYNEK